MAHLLNGRYLLSSFCLDAVAALLILIVLQTLDRLVIGGLKWLVGDQTWVRKATAKILRSVFVALFPGTFLLATVQMHPPKIGCARNPADIGISITEHTLKTDDGLSLSAWILPAIESDRPVVVMTHGLGANKQDFLVVSRMINAMNYNVVTFDFRAHGDSEGHTCSLGVTEAYDIKAAHDLAVAEFPGKPVYAWSTSLRAAATLRAAAEFQIFEKIVVDATFSSVKHLAWETKFRYLGPLAPAAWNLSRLWYFVYVGQDIENIGPEYDISNLQNIPVFLIHGSNDPIIPFAESKRLHAAAVVGTELWIVEGAGHSASFLNIDYSQKVDEFFSQ